jgi:hypothetical protein
VLEVMTQAHNTMRQSRIANPQWAALYLWPRRAIPNSLLFALGQSQQVGTSPIIKRPVNPSIGRWELIFLECRIIIKLQNSICRAFHIHRPQVNIDLFWVTLCNAHPLSTGRNKSNFYTARRLVRLHELGKFSGAGQKKIN